MATQASCYTDIPPNEKKKTERKLKEIHDFFIHGVKDNSKAITSIITMHSNQYKQLPYKYNLTIITLS